MKKYNISNYVRYQKDLKRTLNNLPDVFFDEYTRDQLITKFMPLTENLARKFATSHQAIGVLSINDLIQAGHVGLINAVDKIDWLLLNNSSNIEQTIKSFLSKRIKGTIRRYINHNMGDIKIPEWKINEVRKSSDNPAINNLLSKSKSMYLGDFTMNSDDDSGAVIEIEDDSPEYNVDLMNEYIIALLKKHLTEREQDVIRLSYGLDCNKHDAVEICEILGIEGSYKKKGVRISEIKRKAIDKLIEKTNDAQLPDLL
jgi:RNA polymerase sigma factor (sigma-70 family)